MRDSGGQGCQASKAIVGGRDDHIVTEVSKEEKATCNMEILHVSSLTDNEPIVTLQCQGVFTLEH